MEVEALARDYAAKQAQFEELFRQNARVSDYRLAVRVSQARSASNAAREKLLNAAMGYARV